MRATEEGTGQANERKMKGKGKELGMDGKFINTAWEMNRKYVGNI